MKQSDRVMRLVSLLVFIAMTAYLSVYIVHRFVDPVQTALVVTATMSRGDCVRKTSSVIVFHVVTTFEPTAQA